MDFITIKNNQRISLQTIPVQAPFKFVQGIADLMAAGEHIHCVSYFGYPSEDGIRLICCLADDREGVIRVGATSVKPGDTLESLTVQYPAFQSFERELHEDYGIAFPDHPWLKPVRYPKDRAHQANDIAHYPFYSIDSEELHEVGVGPIHAGIIEPGHFRFICNGEQILHLEIQLGYQHRGIEKLFLKKDRLLQRSILAESIAGDTAVGHSLAFAGVWESLCGFIPSERLQVERAVALEMERMAVHTGDLSGICTDIAYQLGSSVFGRLRTPLINFFQSWCGNRFAKSLIRPGKTNFPLTPELAGKWLEVADAFEPDFTEMYDELSDLPTALARFEKTGVVSADTALSIGMVGMAARASGLSRDIRLSHPQGWFKDVVHQPVVKHHGDVFSRVQMRKEETLQSLGYLREYLRNFRPEVRQEESLRSPEPSSLAVSLVEGWRGEICHCAVTGVNGELIRYKIKDPSFHNWTGLALAVRMNDISDFPVCNKSFNLSYCGHDL
ncbi:MAG TPA: NADH-quinone oxidoreductase subunit C [Bacteroidales bacterium]|nr:NADH-quinone oxidoreductase subunit C [Bacteroidales bacterium]